MNGEFQRIHAAFTDGNLDALRAAVDDPAVVPNGQMPITIGSCLVYAIYHSPLAFIRTLLELGADPKAPVDDGFPPLIAALSCARSDLDDVIRLLLSFGADPNQRGNNDYTALHMAVSMRNGLAVLRLLDSGADPALRTRIDEYETPLEMARSAALTDIVALIEKTPRRLRPGLTILADVPGTGELVRRQQNLKVRFRFWLHDGEEVHFGDDENRISEVRIARSSLINGVFYGFDGMRVGGTRRLQIAPHLAFGSLGVPGKVPANALLTVEITIVS